MEQEGNPVKKGSLFVRDWTKGSIVRNLLLLSWPIIVSNVLNLLGPTIDLIWIGRLGSAAIAGVGVAGLGVMLVGAAMMGMVVGVRAMVARFIGAGDAQGANHVARQAFVISAVFSVAMATIGAFFAEPILQLLGVEPDVVIEGAAYMRIMFVGSVAMSFRMMSEGIMQASGDPVAPMRIAVFYRIFHVALCPFLVFGWWIFPSMGVSGAATSNLVAQTLGMILLLWAQFSVRSRLRLTLEDFHVDLDMIRRIVKIGIPASISGVARTFGNLVLMWFMVPFGTVAVAAHSLYQRIDIMLVVCCMGFGMGGGVMVGQNLGARQPERAEKSGWLATGMAGGFMLICSVAILLWAENIVQIFSAEPPLVEATSVYLRIGVAGFVVLGFTAAMQHCILGAGDTMPPMLVTMLSVWLVQIPLAYLLPQFTELGVYGVRWAIVAGMVVSGVTFVIYFRLGRWKRKKV